jgi:hypothetical protein
MLIESFLNLPKRKQLLIGGIIAFGLARAWSGITPTSTTHPANQLTTNAVQQQSGQSNNKTGSGSNQIKGLDPFAGGSDSLVACMVGAAEGTRDLNCGKNQAYYGHEDPGVDKLWNIGTFSVSCKRVTCPPGTDTPEEADVFYLSKLKAKTNLITSQMAKTGAYYTGWDFLILVDLCNQSPEACLGWRDGHNPGAISLLGQLKKENKSDFFLLEARTLAYKNLTTGRFESFRKDYAGMEADQDRRIYASMEAGRRWLKRKGYSQ